MIKILKKGMINAIFERKINIIIIIKEKKEEFSIIEISKLLV